MSGMTDEEKFDKFIQVLKHDVEIEVLKSTATKFEEAARISLRVSKVLWNRKSQFRVSNANITNSPTPIEIGNFERSRSNTNSKASRQRPKDIESNACFIFNVPGCRPYKHKQPEANNLVSNEEGMIQESGDMQENN